MSAAALCLLFIWGQSCLPVSLSSSESGRVLRWVKSVFGFLPFVRGMTHHILRKIAHFTEYAIFGGVLAGIFLPERGERQRFRRILIPIAAILLAAFLDESIQALSDRGDQIADVWLDLGGGTAGGLLVNAVWALTAVLRRNK